MNAPRPTFSHIRQIVLIGVWIVWIVGSGLAHAQSKPISWKLTSVGGEVVPVDRFRGKVVVVSFGATWCPPCREELPALQELAERYQSKGVQVIWISVDDQKVSNAQLREFAGRLGLKIPVLRDPDTSAYAEVGDGSLPTQVIIDRGGKLVGSPQVGFSNRATFVSDMSARLDRVL